MKNAGPFWCVEGMALCKLSTPKGEKKNEMAEIQRVT